ncbi:MAG: methyltransferase domain-containing protein [Thaumarchaeota archaeon]|nr:methyltransferase domain-containing protein [Nitrososphaerota archaeon]
MPREKPTWDPGTYLKFERERTLPCRDLVARIQLAREPKTMADLGCGPGNSTAVLAQRWPDAQLIGVDSSPAMLEKARSSSLKAEWILSDMFVWEPPRPFDLVFSNAALQWLPDHGSQVPRLLGHVADGGALAFQLPSGSGAWADVLRAVTASPRWSGRFSSNAVDLSTHELSFYYGLLSHLSSRVELWETTYVHVLQGPDAVVEWTSGTALRPLLDRLPEEAERASFVADYAASIAEAYPRQPDGMVLFPFLRRFVIAYR